MTDRRERHDNVRVPMLVLLVFLLTLMAAVAGVLHAEIKALDANKVSKDALEGFTKELREIKDDVKEIRRHLMDRP